jgi:hypothetical protein
MTRPQKASLIARPKSRQIVVACNGKIAIEYLHAKKVRANHPGTTPYS